jgi:hypothetical protein
MSSVPPISILQGADASIGAFSRMRWNLFVIKNRLISFIGFIGSIGCFLVCSLSEFNL